MNLETLSGPKLIALTDKRRATSSAMNKALIQLGFGANTMIEIREMAKNDLQRHVDLLREYVDAMQAEWDAQSELDARRRYHGGDKPIRRPA